MPLFRIVKLVAIQYASREVVSPADLGLDSFESGVIRSLRSRAVNGRKGDLGIF